VVFFNYTTMQMTAKIVYYGPGLCGKTTNLQFIHQKTAAQSRGEMVSLETETDRTLFFDLLPLDVGIVGGMKLRLQLYTVPGQVFYNATRKLVLKGVDGIVFVADSQLVALDANVESLNNLKTNLDELRLTLDQVPIVFQYNKRDIRNIVPVERLNEALNTGGAPFFEAAALHGIGVFETLKAISKQAITSIKRKLGDEKKPAVSAKPAAAAPPAPAPEPPAPVAPPPVPVSDLTQPLKRPVLKPPPPQQPPAVTPAEADDLLASLVSDDRAPEEVPLEFAEEDTDQHHVRAVATKARTDIHRELEGLRAITASAPASPKPSPATKELEKRLQDMLVPDPGTRQELKRKATVEVPAEVLKGAGELTLHLGFSADGAEGEMREALTLRLGNNRRLERLTLHIDLEIKGKG
jgi:signal recognition particle receptor subunit beta